MQTLEWLARLVAFDTTSRNSNLQLIYALQTWFNEHHIGARLTYDDDKQKANLLATLPASNGSVDGGLVLSGHTDVVPVDGQDWDSNPFELTQRDDKVYGRGTCDMKGFVAVVLALVPEFKKIKLSQPLHFAFSYDEEVGCRGAPLLIADMQAAGITPKACIVGEPTSMQPIVAHKGIQVFRCRVRGRSAHSSLTPRGCNAIEYAAQLICYIRQVADQFRQKGPFDGCYDVPFTSVTTNMIDGGIAYNTIPDLCEFIFEFRHLPDVRPQTIIDKISGYAQTLQQAMRLEYPGATIEIDKLGAAPSFKSESDAAMKEWINAITSDNEIRKVSYGTEAGLFQQADIATIVCGPGSIEQAHRANEYVELSQLAACEQFLKQVVTSFAS